MAMLARDSFSTFLPGGSWNMLVTSGHVLVAVNKRIGIAYPPIQKFTCHPLALALKRWFAEFPNKGNLAQPRIMTPYTNIADCQYDISIFIWCQEEIWLNGPFVAITLGQSYSNAFCLSMLASTFHGLSKTIEALNPPAWIMKTLALCLGWLWNNLMRKRSRKRCWEWSRMRASVRLFENSQWICLAPNAFSKMCRALIEPARLNAISGRLFLEATLGFCSTLQSPCFSWKKTKIVIQLKGDLCRNR
jgi:hypothetical protein